MRAVAAFNLKLGAHPQWHILLPHALAALPVGSLSLPQAMWLALPVARIRASLGDCHCGTGSVCLRLTVTRRVILSTDI